MPSTLHPVVLNICEERSSEWVLILAQLLTLCSNPLSKYVPVDVHGDGIGRDEYIPVLLCGNFQSSERKLYIKTYFYHNVDNALTEIITGYKGSLGYGKVTMFFCCNYSETVSN